MSPKFIVFVPDKLEYSYSFSIAVATELTRLTPPSLVTDDFASILFSEVIEELSTAETAVAPVTVIVRSASVVMEDANRMLASVLVLTKLDAKTPLAEIPTALAIAATAAVASLVTVASIVEAALAETVRSPAAVTFVSSSFAFVTVGDSVPRSVPSNVSMALNKVFVGAQPIVLNANVTPIEAPVEVMAALLTASISAVLAAVMATCPVLAPVVFVTIWLDFAYASELLRTVFVAITPFAARLKPLPNALPPLDVADASAVAFTVAFSVADTVTSPAETLTFSRYAFAPERRSLRTIIPPTTIELESLMLTP